MSVFSLLLVFSGCLWGRHRLKVGPMNGGEVVEAVGEAVLTEDLLESKQRSLADAQKKAVEMVVGVYVSAKTRVRKATAIDQNILAKSAGYIGKYEVVEEWREAPFYKTKIRALVSYLKIDEDLRETVLADPRISYPKVAVLLKEEGAGEENSAASNALAQALIAKGYRVVDRGKVSAESLEASTAAALGKELDAEILIVGTASARQAVEAGLGGFISYRAAVSAKAYKAETGEILATASEAVGAVDVTREAASMKALEKAGRISGQALAGNLAWELSRTGVRVGVSGVENMSRLAQVQKALSSFTWVGEFYLRSYSQGRAQMEVELESSKLQELADALESKLGAKVQAVTQNSLEILLP